MCSDHGHIQPTCLFTGEPLTPKTKIEHTIPESVGGRIKSRTVSSDLFNHAAGKGVDRKLAQAFSPLFNWIRLAIPGHRKPPSVPTLVQGAGIGCEFRSDGRVARKGIEVERDPRTGKVISATAADPEAIEKHFGWSRTKFDLVCNRPARAAIDVPLLDTDIEIAALKSVLLSFDHVLGKDPDRFTRSSALLLVRGFVKEFVLSRKLDVGQYERTICGLQYDKLPELRRLRELVRTPVTPFEHVMVASANPSSRTVDAVWWMAGVDPYGFRLCTDWRGLQFTYVLVSGVLNGGTWKLQSLPNDFTCKLEMRRRARAPRLSTSQQLTTTAKEVAAYHRDAWQRGVDYALRNCPRFVHDEVVRNAQYGLQESKDGRIVIGLTSASSRNGFRVNRWRFTHIWKGDNALATLRFYLNGG
jgi:hypothetical protein